MFLRHVGWITGLFGSDRTACREMFIYLYLPLYKGEREGEREKVMEQMWKTFKWKEMFMQLFHRT